MHGGVGVGGGGQDSWISPMISGFISVFPSVRSLLHPPTQLLHYGYPRSAAFTFLQPDLSVAVRSLRWECSAARCKPEARWSTRDPCPLSQDEAARPLHLHQQSHTEQVEDAEASHIHMPGCSQPLQTCCTPKRWPTLLGQHLQPCLPPSARELCSSFTCLNTAPRCFLPIWAAAGSLPMPVLLAHCSASPSGPCPFWGGLLAWSNAVLLTVPTAFSCHLSIFCLAGLASSEHHIHCFPAMFSKNVSECCILGKFPV